MNQSVYISIAKKSDAQAIVNYYQKLSVDSKSKFAPHPFEIEHLSNHILENDHYLTIIAKDKKTDEVIAYAVTQLWIFDYDIDRWAKYGKVINNDDKEFACFAPSVADAYQHAGIGSALLNYTKTKLKEISINYILLWGGVKCTNILSVRFYLKNGFKLKGHFDYEGGNYDMLLTID